MKYTCENCGKEFEKDYRGEWSQKHGSAPRFCCKECAYAYRAKKGKETQQIKNLLKIYKCKYCGRECKNKGALIRHENSCKLNPLRMTAQENNKITHNKKWEEAMKASRGKKKPLSITYCKYCGKKFNYKEHCHNHEKYCDCNPNKIICIGRPHTEASKRKLSITAKKNHLGGQFSRKDIIYDGVVLNSSYEEELAKDLDKNNIKWERPSYLIWTDNKKVKHRYYPDFYLPQFNIYLDPKNDYLIEHTNPYFGITDQEKIVKVEQQNNVRVFILNKDQLTWDYIKSSLS